VAQWVKHHIMVRNDICVCIGIAMGLKPVQVAQWVVNKPHCMLADRLMALTILGSALGLEGGFLA